jgi:hypothetical protein
MLTIPSTRRDMRRFSDRYILRHTTPPAADEESRYHWNTLANTLALNPIITRAYELAFSPRSFAESQRTALDPLAASASAYELVTFWQRQLARFFALCCWPTKLMQRNSAICLEEIKCDA